MLNSHTDSVETWKDRVERPLNSVEYDFRWMIKSITRHRMMVAAICLVFVAVAAAYVKLRPPAYSASSLLQLTNLRLNFSREDAFFAETQSDPNFLETQIQLLRSAKIALSVVDTLKLDEKVSEQRGLEALKAVTDTISQMMRGGAPADEQTVAAGISKARLQALQALQRGFKAERVGLSNVVQIEFTWNDPATAAQILNEISNAYVLDQNASRIEAAQAASSWLRERLRDVGPKTRIIAPALPPNEKSNVPGVLIVSLVGFLGLGFAVLLALFRSFADRRISTPQSAAATLQTECLGVIPKLRRLRTKMVTSKKETRTFSFAGSGFANVQEHPDQLLARTLKNVAVASRECMDGRGLKYIGITSVRAGEGKTLVAANLALSLAANGRRVLLVDANTSNPTLSAVATGHAPGLIDCLNEMKLADAFWSLDKSSVQFLPLGGDKDSKTHPDIWVERIEKLLGQIKSRFDYVLFDLPALDDFGQVRASTRYLEGYLLVMKTNSETPDQIFASFNAAGGFYDRMFGCVLNKANLHHIRLFDPANSPRKTRRSWFGKS